MNIGLIAVDSEYPNLALMKISTYHKQQGDNVEWYSMFGRYDIVYMAKVFTFTPDYQYTIPNTDHIEKGGTQPYQQNRVYAADGKSPALMNGHGGQTINALVGGCKSDD